MPPMFYLIILLLFLSLSHCYSIIIVNMPYWVHSYVLDKYHRLKCIYFSSFYYFFYLSQFTHFIDIIILFPPSLRTPRVFGVTPSQPVFYEFRFPKEVDMVLVKANAEDDFCAMVAIQNITVSLKQHFIFLLNDVKSDITLLHSDRVHDPVLYSSIS